MPFSSFIESCKKRLSKDDSCDICSESEILQSVAPDADSCDLSTIADDQIYLAQVTALILVDNVVMAELEVQ